MPPIAMFFLAILTPFILMAALLLPGYVAMFGACYVIYPKAEAELLVQEWFDVSLMIDVYLKLFSHWSEHVTSVSFLEYTLPLIGLPLVAAVLSWYLLKRLLRWLINLFHLAPGGHS